MPTFDQYEIIRTRGGTKVYGRASDGTLIDSFGNPIDPEQSGLPQNVIDALSGNQLNVQDDEQVLGPANRTIPGEKGTSGSRLPNVGGALSLAIPAGVALTNYLQENRGPYTPDYSRVSLQSPRVRGLSRPRFTTRFRRAQGSSLAEREAGLRFTDAQNEARRQQFSAQDQQFRQRQRDRNVQISNRENLINNQITNRQRAEEAMENRRQQERIESMGNNALSAFVSNLSNLINQNTLADSAMAANVYEELIRAGEDPTKAGRIAFGSRYNQIRDRYQQLEQ